MASHPPRPKQPCGGPDKGAAPISPPVTPTTGTGEQRPLLRVLASAGRTHRREVADEIRRALNQLQAPMGQARPQGAGPPPIVQCLDVCLWGLAKTRVAEACGAVLRSGAAQDLAEVTGDQGELILLLPLQLIGVGVGGAL